LDQVGWTLYVIQRRFRATWGISTLRRKA
jgi:hypothetical protein